MSTIYSNGTTSNINPEKTLFSFQIDISIRRSSFNFFLNCVNDYAIAVVIHNGLKRASKDNTPSSDLGLIE